MFQLSLPVVALLAAAFFAVVVAIVQALNCRKPELLYCLERFHWLPGETEVECDEKPYVEKAWSAIATFRVKEIGRSNDPEKLVLMAKADLKRQSPAKCITYDLTHMGNYTHTTVART